MDDKWVDRAMVAMMLSGTLMLLTFTVGFILAMFGVIS